MIILSIKIINDKIDDNLDINCRDIYIRAIHERHDHLKEIIVVHETIKLIERCPDSDFLN